MGNNRGTFRLVSFASVAGLVVLALAALVAPGLISARAAGSPSSRSDLKNYQHVFVMINGEHRLRFPDWQPQRALD